MISAGDALVRIERRKPIRFSRIRVTAGRRDVTRAFAKRRNGKFEGLVTGLKVGRTVLRARAPRRRAARAAIVNHLNAAQTTTQTGEKVPFVVRTETGYQNRDQYKIAVLFQPGKAWTAWAPQAQFNHKLLIAHGASCGIDHQAGEAPGVTDGNGGTALGLGFAVMSTALDNAGHNCNIASCRSARSRTRGPLASSSPPTT